MAKSCSLLSSADFKSPPLSPANPPIVMGSSRSPTWLDKAENSSSHASIVCFILITLSPSYFNMIFLMSMHTVEGFNGILASGDRIITAKKDTDTGWQRCRDVGDFAAGLALLGTGIYAYAKLTEVIEQHDGLAFYHAGISMLAIAQATKSGYDFIKAASTYLSSQETGNRLDKQRREALFHGLKFIGYTLIGCGFSPAGAAFLGAALAVALYNNTPRLQRCFANFFASSEVSETTDHSPLRSPEKIQPASPPPRSPSAY